MADYAYISSKGVITPEGMKPLVWVGRISQEPVRQGIAEYAIAILPNVESFRGEYSSRDLFGLSYCNKDINNGYPLLLEDGKGGTCLGHSFFSALYKKIRSAEELSEAIGFAGRLLF